jgi:hypothetical protein
MPRAGEAHDGRDGQMTKVRNTTTSGSPMQEMAIDASEHGGIPVGVSLGPGFIEAQERAGQRDLVEAEQLPANMGRERAVFEAMGIEFIGPTKDDPLFMDVRLPQGWKKRATGHAMHNELLDDRSNVRASIFYKAAFYDRRADMHARSRFALNVREFNDRREHRAYVIDRGADPATGAAPNKDHVIFVTETVTSKGGDDWEGYDAAQKATFEAGAAWLDAHYPDWRSPLAHWDVPRLPSVCEFPQYR